MDVRGGLCHVYLVGVTHLSEESTRQVQAIVKFLKPQVVFLELCESRVGLLALKNLKVPTTDEMITMLKKKHNMFEVIYSCVQAEVASKRGVIPGSEFRVAYEEAIKYGGRGTPGGRPIQGDADVDKLVDVRIVVAVYYVVCSDQSGRYTNN
ncbi:traB domain-containing protein [Cajanus cajan]|uniref:traB domain-containing protein n=1 Tax=Cajanus cajan TaxID=3821 RepID=UPI0010FB93F3|nr:traB domain-containing protein [Cajanus cajan]